MFCAHCGTQLPDEANFCMKCGKPLRADQHVDEPRYETCQIVYEIFGRDGFFRNAKIRFWVKAYGPNGEYSVAVSPEVLLGGSEDSLPYGGKYFKIAQKAISDLTNELLKDGWEYIGPYGRSDYWQKLFRRRAR